MRYNNKRSCEVITDYAYSLTLPDVRDNNLIRLGWTCVDQRINTIITICYAFLLIPHNPIEDAVPAKISELLNGRIGGSEEPYTSKWVHDRNMELVIANSKQYQMLIRLPKDHPWIFYVRRRERLYGIQDGIDLGQLPDKDIAVDPSVRVVQMYSRGSRRCRKKKRCWEYIDTVFIRGVLCIFSAIRTVPYFAAMRNLR